MTRLLGDTLADEKTVKRRSVASKSNCPFDAKAAVEYLRLKDKKLAKVIDQVGPFRVELDEMVSPFEALAESIVYQQLTGKAAATIFGRLVALYGDKLPHPDKILETSIETLRGVGLSNAKALAIKDLAEKQLLGVIPDLVQLSSMSDDEIVERLITVRGIGRWTVEMLLIFRLGRPDVLPIHDYGVRKGFAVTYGLKDKLPTPLELGRYGERWSPYRTVAAWYMWRATEL